MKLIKLLCLNILLILCSAQTVANQVGVIAGLHGDIFIERNGIEIPALSGAHILPGDHIRTHQDQIFQLILLDETVFTFAGDVDISLDVFEYDETSGNGQLQITQYSGLMKFSTGHIANGQAGVFQIKQPNADVAVLGTTGVVGLLNSEQAKTYFPQINLPATDNLVSYAALMGPGPRAARWVKSGAFVYSNDQGMINLNRPGGSVLAVTGNAPIEFIAPALDISQAISYDDDKEEEGGTNKHSSATATNNRGIDAGDLSRSLPSASNIESASTDMESTSGNNELLKDARTLINNESMNRVIQRLEQTEGIPEIDVPVIDPATDPVIDPVTDPIIDPVIDPIDTGTGGIVCPGDPSCPVDPAPINPDPFNPATGGLVCPGDPACP